MKRLFLILLLAGIGLSTAIFFYQSRGSQQVTAAEINPAELRQMIQTGDGFYVYFYSPACKDCLRTGPYLAEARRAADVSLYKMDVRKHADAKSEFQIPGTPSLFYYQNGQVQRGISGGYETAGEYEEFFQQGGSE